MKKIIAICVFVFVIVIGVAGPGAAEKQIVLKFGHIFTPTSAVHKTVALAGELIALDGRLGLGINQMIFNSGFDHYR